MESAQSLCELFSSNTLLETGFRKPMSSLRMEDKVAIKKTVLANMILKVKPELDQFGDGLRTCGILDAVRRHPGLMAQLFLLRDVDLTTGEPIGKSASINYIIIIH